MEIWDPMSNVNHHQNHIATIFFEGEQQQQRGTMYFTVNVTLT